MLSVCLFPQIDCELLRRGNPIHCSLVITSVQHSTRYMEGTSCFFVEIKSKSKVNKIFGCCISRDRVGSVGVPATLVCQRFKIIIPHSFYMSIVRTEVGVEGGMWGQFCISWYCHLKIRVQACCSRTRTLSPEWFRLEVTLLFTFRGPRLVRRHS